MSEVVGTDEVASGSKLAVAWIALETARRHGLPPLDTPSLPL
jgi:hypothetical protein